MGITSQISRGEQSQYCSKIKCEINFKASILYFRLRFHLNKLEVKLTSRSNLLEGLENSGTNDRIPGLKARKLDY